MGTFTARSSLKNLSNLDAARHTYRDRRQNHFLIIVRTHENTKIRPFRTIIFHKNIVNITTLFLLT